MSKQVYKNKQRSNSLNDPTISVHEIEVLAYQIHAEKGGTDLENWLEAERMLKERHFSGVC